MAGREFYPAQFETNLRPPQRAALLFVFFHNKFCNQSSAHKISNVWPSHRGIFAISLQPRAELIRS
jgi:hypothetical protein